MRVETTRTLILTKAEQKAIQDVYNLLNDDDSVDIWATWEILDDITRCSNVGMNMDYGYGLKIID